MRVPALLVRACQIAIGLVFVYAALAKLGDLQSFADQVHNFRIVPVASENVVAMTLPWIELIAGLALILGLAPRPAALITAGAMAVFTVAVAAALHRGLDIECGCFGTGDASRVGWLKLFQNLGLLAVALLACLSAGERLGAGAIERAGQAGLRSGGRVAVNDP